MFDFTAISGKLSKMAKGGHFGLENIVHNEKITNEECRLHWAKLDARQWCEPGTSDSASDIVLVGKVNVKPSQCGSGHGNQPSFDEMLKSTGTSSYLTIPTSFPSVVSDSDSDGEVEPIDTAALVKELQSGLD